LKHPLSKRRPVRNLGLAEYAFKPTTKSWFVGKDKLKKEYPAKKYIRNYVKNLVSGEQVRPQLDHVLIGGQADRQIGLVGKAKGDLKSIVPFSYCQDKGLRSYCSEDVYFVGGELAEFARKEFWFVARVKLSTDGREFDVKRQFIVKE
jgi:hypothetical protein